MAKATVTPRPTVVTLTPALVRAYLRETPEALNVKLNSVDGEAVTVANDVASGNTAQDITQGLVNALALSLIEQSPREVGAYRLTQLGRYVTGTKASRGGGVPNAELQALRNAEKSAQYDVINMRVLKMIAHLPQHPTSMVAVSKCENAINAAYKAIGSTGYVSGIDMDKLDLLRDMVANRLAS